MSKTSRWSIFSLIFLSIAPWNSETWLCEHRLSCSHLLCINYEIRSTYASNEIWCSVMSHCTSRLQLSLALQPVVFGARWLWPSKRSFSIVPFYVVFDRTIYATTAMFSFCFTDDFLTSASYDTTIKVGSKKLTLILMINLSPNIGKVPANRGNTLSCYNWIIYAKLRKHWNDRSRSRVIHYTKVHSFS